MATDLVLPQVMGQTFGFGFPKLGERCGEQEEKREKELGFSYIKRKAMLFGKVEACRMLKDIYQLQI